MGRPKRRKFTTEYKAEVVELVRTSGKSAGQVAHDQQFPAVADDAEGLRDRTVRLGRETAPPHVDPQIRLPPR